MEENISFFKYIYQDDLFIIDEPKKSIIGSIADPSEPKPVDKPKLTIAEESKPVTFFGRNANKLLILVTEPKHDFLSQTDFDFLMKIMESGLNYSKNDFALVNLANWPLKQVLEEIPYDYMLSFGTENSMLTNGDNLYQISENNGKKTLYVDSLDTIETDVTKKKQLWSALKNMFKI